MESIETFEYNNFTVKHQTANAFLVVIDDVPGEHWLPKSICDIEDNSLIIPMWLCEKKGIIT